VTYLVVIHSHISPHMVLLQFELRYNVLLVFITRNSTYDVHNRKACAYIENVDFEIFIHNSYWYHNFQSLLLYGCNNAYIGQ
jgi:hypothetical protein